MSDKMNILLLYPFYNQKNLISNFSKRMGEKGVHVDSICIANMDYEKTTDVDWPSYFRILLSKTSRKKTTGIYFILHRIIYHFLLSAIFRKYDAIDFHAYYPQYNKLMKAAKKNNNKYYITLWGSDLMRANDKRRQQLRYGFDHCSRIKLSDNLFEIMRSHYSGAYDKKCRIVYFGNSDFDDIDLLDNAEYSKICYGLFGDTNGRRIVTCGYNAMPAQNHETIIMQLNTIDRKMLKACHFVFPLTYGGDEDYKRRIIQYLDESGLHYTALTKFMTNKEIAALRKISDVVINIQNTDALAGSLQDHLYCGGVCIIGEWLRYIPYDNNNIYYIKTKKENIAENLVDVLVHFDSYHEKCIANHEKIRSILSWEATIEKQKKVYGE